MRDSATKRADIAKAAIVWASTPPNQPEAARASLTAFAQAGAEVPPLAFETGISDRLPVNLRAFVVNAGRPVALLTLMERPTSEWIVGAPAEPMLVRHGDQLVPTEACWRWAGEETDA